MIYVYRPHALECDLADQRARALLLKYGYTPENPNCCVVHLIRRLCAAKNIFEKYDMCSKAYSRQWLRGKSIEQLTVAG